MAAAMLAGCSTQTVTLAAPTLEQGAAAEPPSANGYKLLYSFKGGKDGRMPWGPLTDVNGKLYGTTQEGGTSCFGLGCGTVYEVSTTGKETVLYRFLGGTDGWAPRGGLTLLKGELYGTTSNGGGTAVSYGTIYDVTTAGKEHVLHSFTGSDGSHPEGGVTSVNGMFFGTASEGGASCGYSQGCGTIFSITAAGKFDALYTFKGRSAKDGAGPYDDLTVLNSELFGTTTYGGTAGVGVVFRSTLSGKEQVAYNFDGDSGSYPNSGFAAMKGNLYGTAPLGGANGDGVVFEITAAGKLHVIYAFKGTPDGSAPTGRLLAVNGYLYGTTGGGGTYRCYTRGYGCGTIFKVSTTGKETVLYDFKGGNDAAIPVAGLLDLNGVLYGTTMAGGTGKCSPSGSGAAGCGAVYEISP